MNPDTVTTSQIVGALTPKHWVAIISAIGAIASSGYWVGQRVAEAQALIQAAELKSTVAQLQAKLEVTQQA